MKILSINREHTLSEDQLALNMDKELTPELMKLMSYGDLKLRASGSVLHVGKEEGDAAFNDYFVAELEQMFKDAQQVLDAKAMRHRRMQEVLGRSMKLPLD